MKYHGIHKYLLNERGWSMSSGEILTEFGLRPGHPIPPTYTDSRVIDGVVVRIRAKRRAGMEKRVFAVCPECEREIEAGHLHQHVQAHLMRQISP